MTLTTIEQKIVDHFNEKTENAYTIGELVEVFKSDSENDVRLSVAALVQKEQIKKFGQKRGTRYCSLSYVVENETLNEDGTKTVVASSSKKDLKFKDEILNAIQNLGTKTPLRKIAEFLKQEPNDLRDSLKSLIEENKVSQHGQKKGASYSIFGSVVEEVKTEIPSVKKTIEPKTTSVVTNEVNVSESEIESTDETGDDSQSTDYNSLDEFFEAAVLRINKNKSYDVKDMAQTLIDVMPKSTVDGEEISHYEAIKFVAKLVTKELLTAEQKRDEYGQRYYYKSNVG